jgi:two-component system, NtrC family, response regulator
MKPRILVIDDERNYLLVLRELLERSGYEVETAEQPLEGLKLAHLRSFDAALVDLRMGELGGVEVMQRLRRIDPDLGVAIMTAFASVPTAVDAMKSGASDYVMKPFDNDALLRTLQRTVAMSRLSRENARLREAAGIGLQGEDLVGRSEALESVRRLIRQVAPTDTTVLVTGETGTGKELVAHALHRASTRATQPFVPVHCAALAEGVLESELFGHERGAFTGALQTKRGRFELAQGGTLFLDEIGEISATVQIKLLRAIEARAFERVGGERSIETDARFIAATHRDLPAQIRAGAFREDLFYRLNVVEIHVPPLRERPDDIPLIAAHVLHRCGARLHRPNIALSDRALQLLIEYRWPGNVRELENLLERAIVITESDEIGPESLPLQVRQPAAGADVLASLRGKPLQEALDAIERTLLLQALEESDYVQAKAAQQLGLSKSALHYKLTRHGIRTSR